MQTSNHLSPQTFLSSFSILFLSLLMIFSFLLVGKNLSQWLGDWGSANELTVFLANDLTQSEQKGVSEKLVTHFKPEQIQYLDQKQTLELIRNEFSLTEAGMNSSALLQMMPTLFIIDLSKGLGASIETLTQELNQMPGVEDARYGSGWISRLQPIVMTLKIAGLAVSVLLVLGVYFLIKSVLFQKIISQKKEIEVMELVGATALQIRKPLMQDALALTLLSGMGALLCSFAFVSLAERVLVKNQFWKGIGIDQVYFFTPFELTVMSLSLILFALLSSWQILHQLGRGRS